MENINEAVLPQESSKEREYQFSYFSLGGPMNPIMPFFWSFLILLNGCVSMSFHQKELEQVRLQEIQNDIHLADLVVAQEIEPYHMIKFLEERKEK